MLPRADSIMLNPVGRVEAARGLDGVASARQEAFQRSLAGQLGQSLQGDVQAKLSDGSFIVKVAGTAARMMLPPGARVGSEVALTLVAVHPRPTFQINSGAGGQSAMVFADALPLPAQAGARESTSAAPASPAGLAAQRPAIETSALLPARSAPAGATLQAPDADHAATTLSESGKAIGRVLGAALAGDKVPTAIVARTPVLAAAPVNPQHVALALREAIGKSGLFYEAHLAEWAEGKRPLAELAQEPQMQKPAAGAEAAARGSLSDSAAAQLVNLQLATQELARVAWQGPLWPGQDMQWEIHKDAPDSKPGQDDPDAAPAWRSGLRLRFPLLGELAATVVLAGDQLHIQIQAGDGATGQLLRDGAARLGAALAAAGTPLSSLGIHDAAARGDD